MEHVHLYLIVRSLCVTHARENLQAESGFAPEAVAGVWRACGGACGCRSALLPCLAPPKEVGKVFLISAESTIEFGFTRKLT